MGHFFCFLRFFKTFAFSVNGAQKSSGNPFLENRPKNDKNQRKILENHIKFDQMTASDRVTPIKPTQSLFYVGETTITDENTQLTAKIG